MKLFSRMKYIKNDIEYRVHFFLGIPYSEARLQNIDGKMVKTNHFPSQFFTKKTIKKDVPFFYLKVNSIEFFTKTKKLLLIKTR